MGTTNTVPNVPLDQFKRTKIIATLGPATDNYLAILALIKAGANGIRLNFSHGDPDSRLRQLKWIRLAAKEYGKPVAVIQDLQGPKVRLSDFEGIINVRAGQELSFQYEATTSSGHIPVAFNMAKRVKRGERLLLVDGRIQTVITSIKDDIVRAKAENDGILTKRKGINLPDSDFGGHIITKKDKEDLAFGSTLDIDYVAISFIQTADDVRAFRRLLGNLGSHAKIIAKIETAAAVENIEAIMREADAVMVARGDLAADVNPEVVPTVQRQIINLGLAYAKPTIVATQMLVSMTDNLTPTRAEASDIATAVLLGADAVMLSEETAVGKYPTESVSTMKRVILYTQANSPDKQILPEILPAQTRQNAICTAVIDLAEAIGAAAIVAETKSGATALELAARRPERSIIAVTSDSRVAQQLALVYGVKTYVRPDSKLQATKLTNWLRQAKVLKKGDMVVTASGQYPGVVGTTDTIKVRVLE